MNWDNIVTGKAPMSFHEIAAKHEGKLELAAQLRLSRKTIAEFSDQYTAEMNDQLVSTHKHFLAEEGFKENTIDIERQKFVLGMRQSKEKNIDRKFDRQPH